ncbi:MAG TPA: vitamin K epoxide reductase family protein [Abditibacteriaceae bacterium]
MTPRELSEELRNGQSDDLRRRRWILGLSLVGCAMGQIVSLYQTGIVKRLPDPPLPLIDSNKVDASDYAYKRFRTPDALMMISSYATTAWLAGADGENRAEKTPALPLAMAAKTALDLGVALELGREEWAENKALCFYCQIATLCSLASLVLSLPEARRAWKSK